MLDSLYPKYVFIELTKNCNLYCIMCREKKLYFDDWYMSDEILEKVMKTIVPHAEVVDLRGWGESSLDPRLPKLIDKISQLGKKTVLYTNLNTHNPSYWKNIIKKGTFLAISIESGNKENYKKIRRGGNLEVVKNNLKAIIEECDKNSTFPRPFFTTVISEKNVKEIKSLVDFGLEVGINEIELNPLSRPYHLNKPLGRWFGVLPEFEHETNCYLNDAYEYAKEKGISIKVAANLYHENSMKYKKCCHPWDYCCICTNGDVSFCDHLFHNTNAIMGNLNDDDFYTIWHNNKYEELRKMHDEGIYNQLTEKGLECQWCSKNRYGNLEYLIGNDSRAIDLKMYLKTREVKR